MRRTLLAPLVALAFACGQEPSEPSSDGTEPEAGSPGASSSSSSSSSSGGGGGAGLRDGGTTPSGPEGGAPGTASCPWGAQTPADAASGLSASPHVDGGTADERRVFDRMNAARGSTKLVWDDCLADLARSHSHDMVSRNYYGHGTAGNPKAFLVGQRVTAAELVLAGSPDEDVLMGDLQYFLKGDVGRAVDDYWMTDGHKLPILNCSRVGVGIDRIVSGQGTVVYVTADFACP